MAAKRKHEHPIYIRNRRNIAILGRGIPYLRKARSQFPSLSSNNFTNLKCNWCARCCGKVNLLRVESQTKNEIENLCVRSLTESLCNQEISKPHMLLQMNVFIYIQREFDQRSLTDGESFQSLTHKS